MIPDITAIRERMQKLTADAGGDGMIYACLATKPGTHTRLATIEVYQGTWFDLAGVALQLVEVALANDSLPDDRMHDALADAAARMREVVNSTALDIRGPDDPEYRRGLAS